MGTENRPGFPDKKLFNRHNLCLELFNELEKIQEMAVKDQLEIVVENLNIVLMRMVGEANQDKNVNRQAEEAIAIIDSLNVLIDELKEKNPGSGIYLNYIKNHANTKILNYVRKSVKK